MTDIDKLIRMNIELEGLLRVIRDRDSLEARDLLSEKIEEYTSALNSFLFARPQEAPVVAPAVVEPVDEAPEVIQDSYTDEAPEAIVHAEVEAPEDVQETDAKDSEVTEAEIVTEDKTRLLKAFTLNDRFRFRRELFAGDDEDFHETLKLLADMDSYAEACDYLYNDMMWDRSDPVVKEFMDIVAANMPN